jgi:hypothetical protein
VQRHRDVHDAPAAGSTHEWQHGLRAEKRAEQIDLDDTPPGIGAHRCRRHVEVACGVVDEKVETPVLVRYLTHDRLDTLGISNIQRGSRCAPAASTNARRCRVEALGFPAGEDDVHAERRKKLRDTKADAGPPAGDDADLPREQPVAEDGAISHRRDPARRPTR